MLEIKRTVISLDERDLTELERIITDGDGCESEALVFLKKVVYERIDRSQRHCEVYYYARN